MINGAADDPPRIGYDAATDVLLVDGVAVDRAVFRHLASLSEQPRRPFRVVRDPLRGGAITLEVFEA